MQQHCVIYTLSSDFPRLTPNLPAALVLGSLEETPAACQLLDLWQLRLRKAKLMRNCGPSQLLAASFCFGTPRVPGRIVRCEVFGNGNPPILNFLIFSTRRQMKASGFWLLLDPFIDPGLSFFIIPELL